ncbi:major facilitator superfamily domain-containing protein [Aspergillus floccosus]
MGASELDTSTNESIEPPNGGLKAWIVATGGCAAQMCTFGYINSFGTYQSYYTNHLLPDYSPSSISWIGSLQLFLLYFLGFISGPLADGFGMRVVIVPAGVALVLAVMMTSLGTEYYQLILAQGILGGLANGFIFSPSMSCIGQYFTSLRASAMGIGMSGVGIGGVVFPIVLQELHMKVGFPWAVRVVGFMVLLLVTYMSTTLREFAPRRPKGLFIPAAFTQAPYVLANLALFFGQLGTYTPVFYIVEYSLSCGMEAGLAWRQVAVFNAASFVGRILPNFFSDRLGRFNMSILYTYPIKSLRGVSISEGNLTSTGFQYDRRFMLLKVKTADDGTTTLQNMHVPHFPEMSLFLTELVYPTPPTTESRAKTKGIDDTNTTGKIIVTYRTPRADTAVRTLDVPLQPDVRGLEKLNITMHSSPTAAYNMGPAYNDWFSACFGYPVVLAYLGPHSRRVLGSFAPGKSPAHRTTSASLLAPVVSLQSVAVLAGVTLMLNVVARMQSEIGESRAEMARRLMPGILAPMAALLVSCMMLLWPRRRADEKITFADAAPYMLASATSLDDVSARLPDGEEMDVTKFRPNIVVSGAETAWEEDFWAELTVGEEKARLLLTANCARCQSINVDYATGTMGKGESGNVLKKLMKDRRVDRGMKYSPVFGRYVFLDRGSENARVRVGDEVVVTRRVEERTVYDWPGITTLNGYYLLVGFSATFVISLTLMQSNVAGRTKKIVFASSYFISYCVGNLIGPQLFFESEEPRYQSGFASMVICFAAQIVIVGVISKIRTSVMSFKHGNEQETGGPMLLIVS